MNNVLRSPALLTPAEVEARYGWRVGWLAKRRMAGDGPAFVKAAGRVFYRPADCDAFVERCLRTSTSEEPA